MTPAAQTSEPHTADEIEHAIVPHGSNGECSNPDLCVALTDFRLAIESEAQRLTVERLREARAAISRAHGSLHLGDTDGVDRALEEARAALAREETGE